MDSLVIVKRLNLKYDGSIVGYRVTMGKGTDEYDISKTELKALIADWGIMCIDSASYTVELYSKEGKLYASNGSDAPTLSYLDVVDMLKMYDDIDITGVDY